MSEPQLVKPEQWKEMNFDQLLEQKNIMYNRLEFLMSKGHKELAAALLNGINQLDAQIAASL